MVSPMGLHWQLTTPHICSFICKETNFSGYLFIQNYDLQSNVSNHRDLACAHNSYCNSFEEMFTLSSSPCEQYKQVGDSGVSNDTTTNLCKKLWNRNNILQESSTTCLMSVTLEKK